MKIWDELCECTNWYLGNGISVRFWHDVSVPKLVPLQQHYLNLMVVLGDVIVFKITDAYGNWNLGFLILNRQTSMVYRIRSRPLALYFNLLEFDYRTLKKIEKHYH